MTSDTVWTQSCVQMYMSMHLTNSKLAIVCLLYVNKEVFLHVHVCSDMVIFSLVILEIVPD